MIQALVDLFFHLVNIACALILLWYVFVQEPRLKARIRELEAEKYAPLRRFFP